MKKVKLILGTHNSQPLGLSEKGIEEAYQSAYKPFLSLMYSYPTVNLTLYYTGILLKWFQDNHPEFLMLLNEMIKRKQVELLGGGFYEPVFSLIPPRDRAGQIEKLTTFIRKRFGRRPRGIWITERVWEPNLPITLRGCGMEYTFLDDTHLRSAGLREEELSRPCLTEDQGKTLSVVPITTDLCRCHSSVEPDELIGRILEHPADDEDSVLVLMEEGEEFGMREGSSRRYYEERRLKDFLDLLVDRRDRILTVSAGTHVKDSFPGRKVYIPCTSNGDLMRWSRPTACGADRELGAHDPKVNGADIPNGGFFRQFLSIYPESNLLYAKMMDTHILVDQVRGDKQRKRAATEELWKGESNFPYWHGRSGGLYRNELRKRAYGALIEAERVTRERGIFKPSVSTEDFDMDGQLECVYRGYEINAYIHRRGGTLIELDYIPKTWNYLDSCARHTEPYHASSVTPVVVDWYPRKAFIDHFFSPDEVLSRFEDLSYDELGDFISKDFTIVELDRDRSEVLLSSEGAVRIGNDPCTVRIGKRYTFMRTAVNVFLTIENLGPSNLKAVYGSEINLSPLSREEKLLQISRVGRNSKTVLGSGSTDESDVPEVIIEDHYNATAVSISSPDLFGLWATPIETVTMTGNGISRIYQSSAFVLRYPLDLAPGEFWETRISLRFEKIKR